MADPAPHEKIQALVQLHFACRIALDALPALGDELERRLRQHVETLCEASGAELDRLKPGWRSATGSGPAFADPS